PSGAGRRRPQCGRSHPTHHGALRQMTPPRLLLLVVFLWGSLARADIVAPTVVDSPAAIYPAGSTEQASVVTRVTVDAEGKVTEAEVVESGGPAFDAAALE